MKGELSWSNILSGDYFREFQERQLLPVDAIPTPFPTWNRVCEDDGGGIGLPNGWLVLVGGNSGKGKTNLTLQLAVSALQAKGSAAYVSLEMSHRSLAQRFFAMASGMDVRDLSRGRFKQDVFQDAIARMWQKFPDAKFWTNEGTIHQTAKIIVQMDLLWNQGVDVFFVDYLQLIGLGDEDEINRQVGESISYLKDFCVTTNALVVCISQLNRTTASNIYDSPTKHGLLGGGVIEQAADQVILLDHARYERLEDGSGARTWLILDKNRYGSEVQFPVFWSFKNLNAREGLPDEVDLWPKLRERRGK